MEKNLLMAFLRGFIKSLYRMFLVGIPVLTFFPRYFDPDNTYLYLVIWFLYIAIPFLMWYFCNYMDRSLKKYWKLKFDES